MSDPLSPWGRVEAALAVLAVDPAGVKGLWLRARSGPVRDAVMQALPVARRIHPGIDDVALFGGVDLAATLSAGAVRRSLGILSGAEPVVLTMAERCPPARLSRWLWRGEHPSHFEAMEPFIEGRHGSEAVLMQTERQPFETFGRHPALVVARMCFRVRAYAVTPSAGSLSLLHELVHGWASYTE